MQRVFIMGLIVLMSGCQQSSTEPVREPVKVVVVSMFEHGQVTGDEPGEFQFWVERMPLNRQLAFPVGPYPLRANDQGVLGICVGGGIASAATSITALGMDPRFDLSKAYWVIAGIAGGDPQDATLGSAVWAKHVVDGDLLYEIDAREIPEHWPYGLIPLGGSEPASTRQEIETGWTVDNIHFALSPSLTDWAFELTKHLAIADLPELQQARAQYPDFAAAQTAPRVQVGDHLSASTYWHGELMNRWANDWVNLYSQGEGEFVTTGMEDSGTLTALQRLARQGLVDDQRVMVLRTVSNFTLPPSGKPASWSATAEYAGNGLPALESAYLVGSHVVNELVTHWERYADEVP